MTFRASSARVARACVLVSGLALGACGGDDTTNPALVDAGAAAKDASGDATTAKDGSADSSTASDSATPEDGGGVDAGKDAAADVALDVSADVQNDAQIDSAVTDAADEGG